MNNIKANTQMAERAEKDELAWESMQKLADTLNIAGEDEHHGNKFIVVAGKNPRVPYINVKLNSSIAGKKANMKIASQMLAFFLRAVGSMTVPLGRGSLSRTYNEEEKINVVIEGRSVKGIHLKEGCVLDNRDIGGITMKYLTLLATNFETPTSTKVVDASTRIINKLIGKEHC